MVSRNNNQKAVAGIIRHKETGNIILIDQYRFPVQKRVIELVAGICDKDKSPEETMQEEVQEETGYSQIESIKYLFELSGSAGLTSETTHLYSIIVS
jgi:ADP-ribose pyrophosphatase